MGSILLENVSKVYPPNARVLDGVSFSEEGSGAVGYLGPNGAGKTTTLKLLVGLLRPTSGRALLNGFDPTRDRRRALWDVGAIIESPEPYPSETVFDALERVGALRGLDRELLLDEIDRCHATLHLPPLEWRCGWLSKGERQRVVLAAACLGDPLVLLLDEPTNGMDPGERAEVRQMLNRLKRDHLILMSSHLIPDVAEICDRVIFLDRGRVLKRDTVEHVTEHVRSRAVIVEFAGATPPEALEPLAPWARRTTPLGERRYRLAYDGAEETRSRLLDECRKVGPLAGFSAAVPALEEAYREVLEGAGAREGAPEGS